MRKEQTVTSSYKVIGSSILGALSILFIVAPDVRLPWGMAALDFIALPWLIAFLVFGPRSGVLTATIGSLGIAMLSEELVPWVGATMKFSSTLPLIVVPALLLKLPIFTNSGETLRRKGFFALLMTPAILARCLLMIFLNYYLAVPVLFGINPYEVPGAFNWFFWGEPMAGNALFYFIVGVSLWNTWQGIVDAVLAWSIVRLGILRGIRTAW